MTVPARNVAYIEDFLIGIMAGGTKSPRAAVERTEPRCKICRDESVRVLVNQLLHWVGTPIGPGSGKRHAVTYADILRDLAPLNESRDNKDRITYDNLWVHAKRHYEPAGISAYWRARIDKALGIP